jgi:2-dehydro-3-deoxygalactonokinase
MNILTIDTGTTNTRVTVWRDDVALCQAARQVGVRDTAISGNRTTLQRGVQDTIEAALQKAGFGLNQVDLVLASGMITSNVGLHEVPHLVAPAGLRDLAAGKVQASKTQEFAHPKRFVPGERKTVDNQRQHNKNYIENNSGEEVETMGLVSRLGITEPAVIVLPGSHSKFVHLDADQRITGCVTTLAGELLHVITHNTILADSLESDFATEIDPEMLLAGARSASSIGLGRACFMVRTLGQFTIYERNARANFLLGAVLGADLLTLKNSSAIRMNPGTQFVITGKPLLRESLAVLVSDDDFFSGKVTVTSSEQQEHLAGSGAIAIARERGLVKTLKVAQA